ncbi:MAG: hypothetical protein WAP23_02815 [Candidatus Spechtbacterales bacterium]
MTTTRSGNIQVVLDGRGKVMLRQTDHVATGGEGSVFRIANTAVKVYTDPLKMRRDDMADKVKALTVLQHLYIVAPQGLVLDQSGNTPIGLYMPFVEGEPFPRVFTNDYRTRSGFNDNYANILINRMQDVLKFAHDHKATIVDGNELSWLLTIAGDGPEPRIIDVDSWSIGRWPPKMIMPSIRDWHTNGFNQMTDWFAWGVVSFQVYTGVHPYKGTLVGYTRGDLERRMKDNASVFTRGVRLNQNVRDFSCIPAKLFGWYVDTFQNGMREMPPSPFDVGGGVHKVVLVARIIVTTRGALKYDKLYDNTVDPAICVFPCGVVLLESGHLFDLGLKRKIGIVKSRNCEVIKAENYWLVADWDGGQLIFSAINRTSLQEEELGLQIKGYRLLRYENRLFVVTDQGLTEVELKVLSKPILAPRQTWGVMINSTRWFNGVGVMDAMGATFLIVPFGDNAVGQVRVRELDGFRPVAARAGNRFASIVVLDKNGEYHKVELTFNRDYTTYQFWQGRAENADLNMAILPRGVCAIIADDGELNIFVPTSGELNKIQDKDITTDKTLANWENTVVYIHSGEIWSMRMSS